jgi:hypothetical protein
VQCYVGGGPHSIIMQCRRRPQCIVCAMLLPNVIENGTLPLPLPLPLPNDIAIAMTLQCRRRPPMLYGMMASNCHCHCHCHCHDIAMIMECGPPRRGGLVILFFLIVSFFSLLTWLMMSSNARGLVADEV